MRAQSAAGKEKSWDGNEVFLWPQFAVLASPSDTCPQNTPTDFHIHWVTGDI